MIIAQFFRGPYDGEVLTIPEPVQTFVIAQFEPFTVEWFYLLAGEVEEDAFAYLYGGEEL